MKDFIKNIKEVKTKDVVVAMLILVLPLLSLIWKIAPKTEDWQTVWYSFNSNGFGSVNVYFWLLNSKLVLIFCLSIWYITCKHWWRNAILIPLIIEINKILSIINPNIYSIDVGEFYKSLPITLPIIFFLVYLSFKVKYYSRSEILLNDLDKEIDNLICEEYISKKEILENFKDRFYRIKTRKSELTEKDYLLTLINLKKEFLNNDN